ncbi:hypothetical protein Q9R19_04610 [Microbacterium sp. ARD32]|uniref:hypothetical protein n=1 Tax=Microbacterium sp. ARD32 TaxID=2962577 RepID=UPI002881C65C|nr:hypothetical protein [Microbacterium sp. ARD32]MDT0156906.1 hypothetical protein [Microbacterium sp. ARD32]
MTGSGTLRTAAILVEGGDAAWEQAVDDARRVGWTLIVAAAEVSPGRGDPATRPLAPESAGRLHVLAVRSAADAADAALAAMRGHSLLLRGEAERTVLDELCADLRHLGAFAHRHPDDAVLHRTDRALLAALTDGATLTAAARAAHVSRRTADRRVAGLRARFDAPSLAALIALDRDRLDDLPVPMMARITDA